MDVGESRRKEGREGHRGEGMLNVYYRQGNVTHNIIVLFMVHSLTYTIPTLSS